MPGRNSGIEWQRPNSGVAQDAHALRFRTGRGVRQTSRCLAPMHNFTEDPHRFGACDDGGAAAREPVDRGRRAHDDEEHGGAHSCACPPRGRRNRAESLVLSSRRGAA
jgi:hypothetical protein